MADDLLDELLEIDEDEDDINPKLTFEEEDKKLEPLLEEINMIQDQTMRSFVRSILFQAGDSFWKIPSSFSGNHHPPDEHGEGGNVLHTKRVVRAIYLICASQERSGYELDVSISAALLHDLTKGGVDDENPKYDPMHPYTVDRFVLQAIQKDTQQPDNANRSTTFYLEDEVIAQILRLVRCHLGPWSPVPETIPITTLDWNLHLADHLATRLDFIADGPEVDKRRWGSGDDPKVS